MKENLESTYYYNETNCERTLIMGVEIVKSDSPERLLCRRTIWFPVTDSSFLLVTPLKSVAESPLHRSGIPVESLRDLVNIFPQFFQTYDWVFVSRDTII